MTGTNNRLTVYRVSSGEGRETWVRNRTIGIQVARTEMFNGIPGKVERYDFDTGPYKIPRDLIVDILNGTWAPARVTLVAFPGSVRDLEPEEDEDESESD
jgi:hypothetical protein